MTRRIRRLKPKKIKGKIQLLKALPYKGNMIYVRCVDKFIFEYIAVFKNEVYTNYMVITPRKGQTKLSKDEMSQCAELLWAGGEASIDALLGVKLDKKKSEIVEALEKSQLGAEKLPN